MPIGDEKRPISWQKVELCVDNILRQLYAQEFTVNTTRITRVHGVYRGGIIPAVVLAHKANLQLIVTLEHLRSEEFKSVLVVDDIAEKGVTLATKSASPTAALFRRATCSFIPDYVAEVVPVGVHLQFPWETDLSTFGGRGA